MHYKQDILKNGFEQTTIDLPNDYEGNLAATLIRKKNLKPSAIAILCIHGFNDYFFQEIIAEEFLKKDYNFYALDLRKYGRSILKHQKPNNVRDLSEYFEDIDKALEIIKAEGNTQIILYGHSTGGLISTLYTLDGKKSILFDVLICNSPFYDFNVPWIQKKTIIPILAFIGRISPNFPLPIGFSKFYGMSLHEEDFGEWNYNLKWKPHFAPSINAGWVNAINLGHKKVANGISIDKPILILHSLKSICPSKWTDEVFESDIILNIEDIIQKSKGIIAKHKAVIAIDGAMHDIVLSKKPVRNKVFTTIFEWLKVNFDK
jgi:alpha-beta hydrolase superfamily lysophospholipase